MNRFKDRIIKRKDKNGNPIGPWLYVINATSSYCDAILAENTNVPAKLRRTSAPVGVYMVLKKNIYTPPQSCFKIPNNLFNAVECGKQTIIDFDINEKTKQLYKDHTSSEHIHVIRFSSNDCGKMYVLVEDIHEHQYAYSKRWVLRVALKYICTI